MKLKIQAFNTKLTDNEIRDAIGAKELAAIKSKDANPLFQAYSVLIEGESTPNVIGEGSTKIEWPRSVIDQAGGLIKKGLQFFHWHKKDSNSTDGRESLGEVVGKITKEIFGKLTQIAIGYFPDKSKVSDCDVCSIEADFNASQSDFYDGKMYADNVSEITAIALASSDDQSPAFPGATKLAQLQAFNIETTEEEKNKLKEENNMAKENLTFNEVIQGIKDFNIHPNQAFTLDQIKGDHVFNKIFADSESNKTKAETLSSDLEKANGELKEYQSKLAKSDGKERWEALIGDKDKFTDEQRNYFNKRFEKTKEMDYSEDGLAAFLKEKQEDYKDAMSTTSTEENPNPGGGNSDTITKETPTDNPVEEALDNL